MSGVKNALDQINDKLYIKILQNGISKLESFSNRNYMKKKNTHTEKMKIKRAMSCGTVPSTLTWTGVESSTGRCGAETEFK